MKWLIKDIKIPNILDVVEKDTIPNENKVVKLFHDENSMVTGERKRRETDGVHGKIKYLIDGKYTWVVKKEKPLIKRNGKLRKRKVKSIKDFEKQYGY